MIATELRAFYRVEYEHRVCHAEVEFSPQMKGMIGKCISAASYGYRTATPLFDDNAELYAHCKKKGPDEQMEINNGQMCRYVFEVPASRKRGRWVDGVWVNPALEQIYKQWGRSDAEMIREYEHIDNGSNDTRVVDLDDDPEKVLDSILDASPAKDIDFGPCNVPIRVCKCGVAMVWVDGFGDNDRPHWHCCNCGADDYPPA